MFCRRRASRRRANGSRLLTEVRHAIRCEEVARAEAGTLCEVEQALVQLACTGPGRGQDPAAEVSAFSALSATIPVSSMEPGAVTIDRIEVFLLLT